MTNKKIELSKNALKEFFELIRDENEGKITKEKLGSVANELGYNLSDDELQDMIEVADPVGDGAVTYKGLAKMVHESHQEFPRLKTSIEEIRRELTSTSIAEKTEEKTSVQDKMKDQDSNNNTTVEQTTSTSKSVFKEVKDETLNERPTYHKSPTSINADVEVEVDSAVVIGKVIKAQETDNWKVSGAYNGKGHKTMQRPPLILPISIMGEDRRSTAQEISDKKMNNLNRENTSVSNRETVDDINLNKDVVIVPVEASPTKMEQAKPEQSEKILHSKSTRENIAELDNINGLVTCSDNNEKAEANHNTKNAIFVEQSQSQEEPFVNGRARDVHSSLSAATRFSLDAGVVTAVDAYHVDQIRPRTKKKLEKQSEQENIDEVEEPPLDVVQETPDLEDASEISQDSKLYIRDKTKRVRRKASLTHSHEDTKKPLARKRSLSKGRAAKSKGPVKPNDKHSVFYSGLGCALKISQIRTKQRLLYQMWQLVYDEAMTRVQQQFHYDYHRDPVPVPKEKIKQKKKVKRRSSSSDYD